MQVDKINLGKATVLLMVIGISLLFYTMIKGFLMAILLSAIFSGILYGFYNRLLRRLGGRKPMASMLTLLFFILVVLVPVLVFTVVVAEQAINAGKTFVPIVEAGIADPDSFVDELDAIPIIHDIFPEREKLIAAIDKAIKSLGAFIVSGLSSITTGAVNFFFQLFIFLFAMYYFLIYGMGYINKMLYYLPLHTAQERILLDKFVTVTRSTLKGTLIIGLVQGGLAAGAMALAGIGNTVFWGVIMAVLSIIPALGPAIVWLPAAVLLVLGGDVPQGIGLLLFGAVVISNIDNLLRPRLMGRDTQLPDLMILFGTLGGLALFGMAGIIIGPIIAALFITILEIYGETFKDQLQPVQLVVKENIIAPPVERNTGDESLRSAD